MRICYKNNEKKRFSKRDESLQKMLCTHIWAKLPPLWSLAINFSISINSKSIDIHEVKPRPSIFSFPTWRSFRCNEIPLNLCSKNRALSKTFFFEKLQYNSVWYWKIIKSFVNTLNNSIIDSRASIIDRWLTIYYVHNK